MYPRKCTSIIAETNDSSIAKVILLIIAIERVEFMSDDKQKKDNENVSFDNDQLGENKNNNGGGKKDSGCGCGKSNK
ncbi:MAG: hypothetical protein ACYDG2_05510 [Ruminiclostridium sp.]